MPKSCQTVSGISKTCAIKKAPIETQTLRAGCSKARAKNFRPTTDPLPGGAGRPKFNQLEMVTTITYKPSLVKIDSRNFELSWKQTHPQTHRQDRLQYTAPQLSAQCNQTQWRHLLWPSMYNSR